MLDGFWRDEDTCARILVGVSLLLLTTHSTWVRYRFLSESPYPVGVDGYYYAVQMRSLLATGTLRFSGLPFAFWLMAPFAAVLGPIAGVKLAAALAGAAVAPGIYLLVRSIALSRGAALAAAAFATQCEGSFFLGAEFVKNGIGLTLWTYAVWLLLRAFEAPSKRRLVPVLLTSAAVALTHEMAALFLLLAAAAALVAGWRGSVRARARLHGASAFLALLLVSLMVMSRSAGGAGLPAMRRLFTSVALWDAPAMRVGHTTLPMRHEAAIGAVAALFALLALARKRRDRPLAPSDGVALMGIGLGLFIALPWIDVSDAQGLGFRLRVSAFLPLALNLGVAAAPLIERLARFLGSEAALVPAAACFLLIPACEGRGIVRPHPEMVKAAAALSGIMRSSDVVIASERQVAFMTAWYTEARVLLHPETTPAGSAPWRLLTLAFIRSGSPLDALLMEARSHPRLDPPIGTHSLHPNGLVLVPEPTWNWCLSQLTSHSREYYESWPTL